MADPAYLGDTPPLAPISTLGASTPMVRVLDEDPDLASAVPPGALREARLRAVAPALVVPVGVWAPPTAPRDPSKDLGLLILSGVLTRDSEVAGRTFTELRGTEDLLRPWDDEADVTSVTSRVGWAAAEPTQIAWLDGDFASAVAPWPEITATLIARAVRRARLLSFRLAILELRHVHIRVLLLLWHLADRWGRVRPEGICLDLRLTHELLARMVGAHRTSVTVAVNRLAGEGCLKRSDEGAWILLGDPPDQLSDL